MTDQSILVEVRQGVCFITLNRPDVLNSFNAAMAAALQGALRSAGTDDQVRAVLITGAGRAFCAGQDLADVPPGADLGAIVLRDYNPVIQAIRSMEKPVLAAVNGIAAGAGANLAFACDIVIAAEEASFVQSFVKVGLIPDSGGTWFLPRLIGLPRATALAMLGDRIHATQAEQWGLVWKVVPGPTLPEVSESTAIQLASQPTRGIGLIKRGLNRSLESDLQSQLAFEAELQREAGATDDYAEGVQAFLAKRPPAFTGR
jgi:2-(1,2-epoxy-1,2-dihydrophenyl)acetyl-CoA isomerase